MSNLTQKMFFSPGNAGAVSRGRSQRRVRSNQGQYDN